MVRYEIRVVVCTYGMVVSPPSSFDTAPTVTRKLPSRDCARGLVDDPDNPDALNEDLDTSVSRGNFDAILTIALVRSARLG